MGGADNANKSKGHFVQNYLTLTELKQYPSKHESTDKRRQSSGKSSVMSFNPERSQVLNENKNVLNTNHTKMTKSILKNSGSLYHSPNSPQEQWTEEPKAKFRSFSNFNNIQLEEQDTQDGF